MPESRKIIPTNYLQGNALVLDLMQCEQMELLFQKIAEATVTSILLEQLNKLANVELRLLA